MAQAVASQSKDESNANEFLARVYILMFVGLAVTGLIAYWVGHDLRFQLRLASNPWIGWGLLIVQFIVVIVLAVRAMKMSPAVAAILFLVYAALTGLTFSSIFVIYSNDQIFPVFFVTSAMFLVVGLFGTFSKRDMSGAGHFLSMLLIGWIIAWLSSWFFGLFFGPFTNINWFLNYAGIALFVGLTARDTQRMKQLGAAYGRPGTGGLVANGALQLYLDYINLFLLILRVRER